MKITFDERATYVYIRDIDLGGVAYTQEIAPNTYADYNEDGQLLGIEFLGKPEIIEYGKPA